MSLLYDAVRNIAKGYDESNLVQREEFDKFVKRVEELEYLGREVESMKSFISWVKGDYLQELKQSEQSFDEKKQALFEQMDEEFAKRTEELRKKYNL